MGGFEVYFMGTKIFSKIKKGTFPVMTSLAKKIQESYQAYLALGSRALY